MVKQMNQDAIKGFIIFFFGLAYVVGIGYGELMFLQIVSKIFPSGAAGGFAMIGAVVAGITALGMPIALHWWFAPGAQFLAGVLFYMVDLAMIGANAMLSYQIASGGPIDPLFLKWREFCPATPIFCVAGLALVFSFDISHKLRHAQTAIRTVQIERVARGMEQGMNTQEAQQYLAQVGMQAMWMAAEQLHGQAIPQMLQPPTPTTVTPQIPQIAQPLALPPAQPKQGFLSRLLNGKGNEQAQAQMAAQLSALQQQLQQLQTNVPNTQDNAVTGQWRTTPLEGQSSPLPPAPTANQNGNGAH